MDQGSGRWGELRLARMRTWGSSRLDTRLLGRCEERKGW